MLQAAAVNIGPIHKKDVIKASIMHEFKPEYATILAFDVPLTKEGELQAKESQVKVFTAEIIYHLFDQFTKYMADVRLEQQAKAATTAVYPAICKVSSPDLGHFLDTSSTLPRHFLDTSSTLPRPFLDPSSTLPRSRRPTTFGAAAGEGTRSCWGWRCRRGRSRRARRSASSGAGKRTPRRGCRPARHRATREHERPPTPAPAHSSFLGG